MPRGLWTGLEKATGNLSRTGLGLLQIQNQREHQATLEADSAARLGIAKQVGEQTTTAFENQQKERQDKIDNDNQPYDITTDPKFLALPEEERPKALKHFSDNGFTDTNGIGTRGSVTKGQEMIGTTESLFKRFMGPVVKRKQRLALDAYKKWEEAKLTGDPKKIQTAQSLYAQLHAEYQASMGNYKNHLGTFEEKGKSRTDQEFFVEDPEGYAAYQEAKREAGEGPSGVDQKRLLDAINLYEKNPTSEKFMVVKDMADGLGYDLGEEVEPKKGSWDRFKEWAFGKGSTEDYGTSEYPNGTTATNAEGIKIISKNGKWVAQ